MKIRTVLILAGLVLSLAGYAALQIQHNERMGRQNDGSFIVSSGQHIDSGSISFDGRPVDIAMHPGGLFFAVLGQNEVFLANRDGVIPGSAAKLSAGASYHGLVWSPDGSHLYASVSNGWVEKFRLEPAKSKLELAKLIPEKKIDIRLPGETENPRPGGMTVTKAGDRLFVAAMDRNSVVEVDLQTDIRVREFHIENLPFEVKLSADEKSLIVSNWGGRIASTEDERSASGNTEIVVDSRGLGNSGTVSIIRRDGVTTHNVEVGLHPTAIAIDGDLAYIANAASDSISVVNIPSEKIVRTIPLKWKNNRLFGSMPCALAISGNKLYCANGGDNAICEIEIATGKILGYRPAGYYPMGIALDNTGSTAYVVNTKGNGSTRKTIKGQAGNAHDFQGTVSIVDLSSDIEKSTAKVAENNNWNRDRRELNPNLQVYKGAIQHVIYIIKENRTYDQILGDLPQGNGDPKLCDFGRNITPNAHALAEQFTLFDNGYVSGTNSADGHAWSTQSLANDSLEHFYTGYRTYPDDGDDAMGLSASGFIWEKALEKGKSFRDYGEFCDDELAVFTPTVKSWLEVWKDRESRKRSIHTQVNTRVASLRPYIHPNYVYWPLLQSDQERADIFIGDYARLSKSGHLPNLMILSLPCDHTEGRDPNYPKPQSMVADNDLALGRIVEAVSRSPEWKHSCIFVIEDDAQAGLDHVDGHRTVYMALSPYTRRKFVDHTFYTTASMLHSIELMLGLDPMNRFDSLSPPLSKCFMATPDFTPFRKLDNQIALDDMNPPKSAQTGKELYWTNRSLALDWSGPDRPDARVLNEVIWHTIHGVDKVYPGSGH